MSLGVQQGLSYVKGLQGGCSNGIMDLTVTTDINQKLKNKRLCSYFFKTNCADGGLISLSYSNFVIVTRGAN